MRLDAATAQEAGDLLNIVGIRTDFVEKLLVS